MLHHFCRSGLFFNCRRIHYFETISKSGSKYFLKPFEFEGFPTIRHFLNLESAHINDTVKKEDELEIADNQLQRGFY